MCFLYVCFNNAYLWLPIFREVSGVNSPLGAKQICPSPNACDAQNIPKTSERVNVYPSFSKHMLFLPCFIVVLSSDTSNAASLCSVV